MAEDLPLSDAELKLLRVLVTHKTRFMMVGLSGAALQGDPVVTEDVDLWVEDLQAPGFQQALASVDVGYCPPFGMNPPMLAGDGCEQIDLVMSMSGLGAFAEEFEHAIEVKLGRLKLPVLSLERIIASKTAATR